MRNQDQGFKHRTRRKQEHRIRPRIETKERQLFGIGWDRVISLALAMAISWTAFPQGKRKPGYQEMREQVTRDQKAGQLMTGKQKANG